MKYTRNSIYDYIVTNIRLTYPNLYCTSKFFVMPEEYPALYLHEINRERTLGGATLNDTDDQYRSDVEIKVIANDAVMRSSAFSIMDKAVDLMQKLHYRLIVQNEVDNTTTFTVVSRFRRTIGGDENIPS